MAPMTCAVLNITEEWSHICRYGLISSCWRGYCLVWFHWVFCIFGVFQVDLRNLLSVLVHGGIHGRYIRLLIYYCIVCILFLWEAHGIFVRKTSSPCSTGKAAGLAEAGHQEPWNLVHADSGVMNHEPHRSFLQRDAFIVYLTLIMAFGSQHPLNSLI